LAKSKSNIVSREKIMMEVWGQNDYFIGRSLDVFISKLRKHLQTDPRIKIETIPTVGVLLNISES
ncbi:MAG: winged helix-turn-helix domain-containing protein, partial [Bacteroidales bacterium]